MNFRSGLKILVVVVVLVVVVLLVHNLKPDPQINLEPAGQLTAREDPRPGETRIIPTADPKWNLYRNFKYGFQIQYPSDWEFIKIYKTGDGTGDIFIGFSTSGVDSMIVLNIYHNLDINSFITKFDLNNLIKYKKISINDKDIFIINNQNPDSPNRGYFLANSNNIYNLAGGGYSLYSWYIDRMIETLEVF